MGVDLNGKGNWRNTFSDKDNKRVNTVATKKWEKGDDAEVEEKRDFLKFLILLLPQVQIHAVRRGRLINFILFTSELNF